MQRLALLAPGERIQAQQILSVDPSGAGLPGFNENDVQLVGRYLAQFIAPGRHPQWHQILAGEPQAYAIALHEAREIEALVRAGVDISDRLEVQRAGAIAHAEGLLAEMRYLQDWARREGWDVSLAALAIEKPWVDPWVRGLRLRQLRTVAGALAGSSGTRERQKAIEFFRKIRALP